LSIRGRKANPANHGARPGRIAAIEQQTSLDGGTARARLRALIRLYSERVNTAGMAVELAIRQWARSDDAAADAVASVEPRG
jgi:hypothetical protein